MTNKDIAVVFDCGATNVRVIAMDSHGNIVASKSTPNVTQPDSNYPEGLIWDVEEIWGKFVSCFKNISSEFDLQRIGAITVTTFGVNGAPVDKNGKLLYPVISWQCQRTEPIMNNIGKYIALEELYNICGINKFSFNTINVLIWLKENRPEILDQMEGWLFIPSIFINKMCGSLVNDTTMAGTSMLTDRTTRKFSDKILNAIGVPNKFFEIHEPGTIAGKLSEETAQELGMPSGIPIVLAGHDTQFALIGSGAGVNDAVLSSGTWEILMTRCKAADISKETLKAGFTTEFDAERGLFNTGAQWLASGVLEWVKNSFYSDVLKTDADIYETMISEAENIDDKHGLSFSPDFVNNAGSISGLGLHTKREQVYRAAIEALAIQTKQNLDLLQEKGKFKADSLILVGGGSKNRLWNQLRANKLGIPVKISEQTETTVLGASLFAHTAIGNFNSINEAIEKLCRNYKIINPE